MNNCIEKSSELSNKIFEIEKMKLINTEGIINNLQVINNELSALMKNFGTENLEDLLSICFGSNNKVVTNDKEAGKFLLLKKWLSRILLLGICFEVWSVFKLSVH